MARRPPVICRSSLRRTVRRPVAAAAGGFGGARGGGRGRRDGRHERAGVVGLAAAGDLGGGLGDQLAGNRLRLGQRRHARGRGDRRRRRVRARAGRGEQLQRRRVDAQVQLVDHGQRVAARVARTDRAVDVGLVAAAVQLGRHGPRRAERVDARLAVERETGQQALGQHQVGLGVDAREALPVGRGARQMQRQRAVEHVGAVVQRPRVGQPPPRAGIELGPLRAWRRPATRRSCRGPARPWRPRSPRRP